MILTLPKDYRLLWYSIRSVLGQGGFGVTYLAEDTNLRRPVAIKEYMPAEFSVRDSQSTVQPRPGKPGAMYQWGLERFLSEAQTLAKFDHPNIVRVLNVFEMNNTAYMVMSYEQGQDLTEYLKLTDCSEKQLLNITLPILDGLAQVHQTGFIHRDIKPANIYLRQDGSPVLLDFGSARQAVGGQTQTLTALVSHGYTPFEQYHNTSVSQGAAADIYAMGATLYKAITRKPPIDALIRSSELLKNGKDPYQPVTDIAKGKFSPAFLSAIDQALSFHPEDRPESVQIWRELLQLKNAQDASTLIQPRYEKTRQVPGNNIPKTADIADTAKKIHIATESQTLSWRRYILAGIVLIALAVGAALFIPIKKANDLNTEITTLLDRASDAFSVSQLTTPEDNNALAYYQKVLQLDPDNLHAKQGVEKVFTHYLQQVNHAIDNEQLSLAEEVLSSAAIVFPDHPKLIEIRKTLQQESQQQLLATIQLHIKAGNEALAEKDYITAVMQYRAALKIDPNHEQTQRNIDKASIGILAEINQAIDANQLQQAESLLSIAQTLNLSNADIEQSKAKLLQQQSLESEKSNIHQLLQRANQAYQKNHLTSPLKGSALAYYREILQIDPGNIDAEKGLDKLANYFVNSMDKRIHRGDINTALSSLEKAETIRPQSDFVTQARARWEQAKTAASPPTQTGSSTATPNLAVATAPPSINAITRPDIEVLSERFNQLKNAIEQRNISRLREITSLSGNKQAIIEQIFHQYPTIKVSISGLRVIKQTGEASAFVAFQHLEDKHGNHVIPGSSWKKTQVLVKKSNGHWQKLQW